MTNFPRFLVVTLAAIALAAACAGSTPSPQPSAAGSLLDGQSFDIVMTYPGEAAEKDTVNFAGGKFESAVCTPLGFPKWTPYEARAAGGATEFSVVTRHPDGTTMDWRGTVRDAGIEGKIVRTMKGKAASGTFKGSRRK